MRLVITLIFITFVFVQNISAQTQSFYRLYPELDTNYSHGIALHFDSTGYYLLYTSTDAILGNQYQAYIAKYDTNNIIDWIQPYIFGTDGCFSHSDFISTNDNNLAFS